MKRLLGPIVLALLIMAVASRADAGYLIIRIVIEGGSAGGSDSKQVGPGGGNTTLPGTGPSSLQPGGKSGSGKFMKGDLPGMPGTGGGAPTMPRHTDPAQCVVAVIPFEEDYAKQSRAFYPGRAQMSDSNPGMNNQLRLTYRGEKLIANLFTDGSSIQWYDDLARWPAIIKTYASEVRDSHKKWVESAKKDPKALLTVVESALAQAMVDEAVAYADELLAFIAAATMMEKASFPLDVRNFAAVYGKMQQGIKEGAGGVPKIKRDFGNKKRLIRSHYCVLYGDATTEADAARRIEFLEENFKAFFLWHAVRGVELPLPTSPLPVILTNTTGSNQPGVVDVYSLAKALDGPTRLPADGFYSPEHDLLILSPDRIDEVGVNFTRYTQPVYQSGNKRDELLQGKGPALSLSGQKKDTQKPEDVARMQTIALVERFVEDDAIAAATSREGSRQLFYATHQFPKYVDLPLWLSNGSGNFFARPKEPAFVTNAAGKPVMHVAVAAGFGVPNYALHRYFKDLIDKGDLNPNRAALLKNVLTDAYFHALVNPVELNDPDPAKDDKKGIVALGGADPASVPPATGGLRPPGGGPGPGGGTTLPPGGGTTLPPGGGTTLPPGGGTTLPPGGGTTLPPGTGPGPGGLRPPGPGGPGGGSMKPPGLGGPGPGGPGMGGPGMGMMGHAPAMSDEELRHMLRKKRERLAIKAQATSWALYYYLAKARPVEFQSFLNELAAMPRDLPLEGASVTAFYRAFKLDGSEESLKAFAQGWLDYIKAVAPVGVDVVLHAPKEPAKEANPFGGTPPGLGPPGPGK